MIDWIKRAWRGWFGPKPPGNWPPSQAVSVHGISQRQLLDALGASTPKQEIIVGHVATPMPAFCGPIDRWGFAPVLQFRVSPDDGRIVIGYQRNAEGTLDRVFADGSGRTPATSPEAKALIKCFHPAQKLTVAKQAAREATIAQKNVRLASIARTRDAVKREIARLKRNKKKHSHMMAELARLTRLELELEGGK